VGVTGGEGGRSKEGAMERKSSNQPQTGMTIMCEFNKKRRIWAFVWNQSVMRTEHLKKTVIALERTVKKDQWRQERMLKTLQGGKTKYVHGVSN